MFFNIESLAFFVNFYINYVFHAFWLSDWNYKLVGIENLFEHAYFSERTAYI